MFYTWTVPHSICIVGVYNVVVRGGFQYKLHCNYTLWGVLHIHIRVDCIDCIMFGVSGLGSQVRSLRFRVSGLESQVWSLRFRVSGLESQV